MEGKKSKRGRVGEGRPSKRTPEVAAKIFSGRQLFFPTCCFSRKRYRVIIGEHFKPELTRLLNFRLLFGLHRVQERCVPCPKPGREKVAHPV